MGGLFSAPKPPAPPPPPPEPDPEEDDRKARLEAIDRRRRGRAGTIETSSKGVMALQETSQDQKKLLGG